MIMGSTVKPTRPGKYGHPYGDNCGCIHCKPSLLPESYDAATVANYTLPVEPVESCSAETGIQQKRRRHNKLTVHTQTVRGECVPAAVTPLRTPCTSCTSYDEQIETTKKQLENETDPIIIKKLNRQIRTVKNRQAAQRSRNRWKERTTTLKRCMKELHEEREMLSARVAELEAQLSAKKHGRISVY